MGVTFIGHSSFFLQIGGKNILVDPNFARWIFVLKRLRRPGLRLRDLPPIDAVLVSHAHFDHLHRPSLRAIARLTRWKSGKRPIIIVPRNVRDLVSDLGYGRIIELDWWQNFQLGQSGNHARSGAALGRAHRARHASRLRWIRPALGQAVDLSCRRHGVLRRLSRDWRAAAAEVALLPIGAYHPAFVRSVHTSPEDAVQAFLDLGARWMVPMHYGTFRLSYEPVDEPVQAAKADAKRRGIEKKICVLEEGVTKFFSE